MPRYAILGSGSSGNSYIFEEDGYAFLLDAGLSARELITRARALGFDPGSIKTLFLSHCHIDHARGARVLCKRLGLRVRIAEGLAPSLYGLDTDQETLGLVPGRDFDEGPLSIRPFALSHDAPGTLGFAFDFGGLRFALVSDTGRAGPETAEAVGRVDVLFLESNYDEEALATGPYPAMLKKRIASRYGHLSNRQAMEFLRLLESRRALPAIVHLCHLSANNNSLDLVRAACASAPSGPTLLPCPRGVPVMGQELGSGPDPTALCVGGRQGLL